MLNETVNVKLEKLPADLKKEVLDYIEFLLQKYNTNLKDEKFRFDWEGGLSDLNSEYTSVEIQHKILEMR